ncbi:MAG: DUF3168 domain-containing protein [Alphaproteobacteria bacterium]|nr:DUF3168 domain-containing protein [Alphaproteobacteria bacterium]
MTDAFFAVQEAVFDALVASSAIQSLLGSPPRIYDHVPPGAVFPYMVFGAVTSAPYDTKTEIGFEQGITLNIWSRYRGSKEAKDILQATYETLHRAALSVTGHVFLSCEFHGADCALTDDGLTTHASVRFSVVTQAT